MNKEQGTARVEKRQAPARLTKPGLILILALVAILFWLMTFSSTPPSPVTRTPKAKSTRGQRTQANPVSGRAPLAGSRADMAAGTALIPTPMTVTRKVLVSKKWNDGPDAFGMKGPGVGEEGGVWGPASVACVNGEIYVMDNVHGRILRYDKDGNAMGSVALTNPSICGDLVANPTDSSLWVIDSDFNTITKVKGDQVIQTLSVPTRNLTDRLLWGYDAASDTLFCQDSERGGDIPILKNGQVLSNAERTVEHLAAVTPDLDGASSLLLDFGKGRNVRIAFGQPLECVEQIVTDGKGNIWMLYNLTGDFRMRRLARIDPVSRTVGVAVLNDVWFAVDGSRHVAPTENGVVLFVGGQQEGSLVAFDYVGGAL